MPPKTVARFLIGLFFFFTFKQLLFEISFRSCLMRTVLFLLFILTFKNISFAESTNKKPDSKTLKVRADIWCPFNCDPKDKNPGYMIEIADTILKKHGYKLDYQLLNWSRSIHEAKIGKTDGVIGAGKEDAEGFYFPSEPQGLTQYSIFGLKKTNWKYIDESSLTGIRIGVINNYSYDIGTNELIKKKHPSLEIVSSDEPIEQLVNLVESNRIIGFVESDFVLQYFLKKKNKVNLKKIGQIKPNSQDLFLAISPKHPDGQKIADLLSQGTIELRKNGNLNKILSKYGLKDWKK